MFNERITELTQKVLDGGQLTYDEGCELANLPACETMDLLACANKVRKKFKGNNIFTCSIVNAKSGKCSENCAYCSQSAHNNAEVAIYPLMSKDEMLEKALEMYKAGSKRFSMVTSGYMLTPQDLEVICETTKAIKEQTTMEVCGSLGMLNEEIATQLKENGMDNYHHNLETARSHVDKICTTHEYDEDIDTVKTALKAGLKVCSGGIMGLGESWEQRVELALEVRNMGVQSCPLNFLTPIKGTRMENQPMVEPMEALKTIAIFRLMNPEKHIPICGGRENTLKDYQSWIFFAGASGLMAGNYLTTAGRNIQMDMDMITQQGFTIVHD